jgi:hypothetical protein
MSEEWTPAGPTGSVLLDIGDDVGALVVYVDAALLGREIEARPTTEGGRPAHASVLERTAGDDCVHAVVIPGLVAGAYSIWLDAALPWGDAVVEPGRVTEVSRRGER